MAGYNVAVHVDATAADATETADSDTAALSARPVEPEARCRRGARHALTVAGVGSVLVALTLVVRASRPQQAVLGPAKDLTSLTVSTLQSGTWCRNYDKIVYKTEQRDHLDACKDLCDDDEACSGVLFQKRSDLNCVADTAQFTCALYTGSCDAEAHPCWERLDVKGHDKFPVTGWGKGCYNWRDIQVGELTTEETSAGCYDRCSTHPGCKGFGYQHAEWGEGPGVGSCYLWKGTCVHEDNPAWNDYTMTDPTPTIYELSGANMHCRNYKQIEILEEQSLELNEWACGVQCLVRDDCIGFSYKPVASCTSNPQLTTTCMLYHSECVPEPNSCWSTFRMTDAGPLNLGPVLQEIPGEPPSYYPSTLAGVHGCATNMLENTIGVEEQYSHTNTLEQCTSLCYLSSGCAGFQYKEDKSCVLLDHLCMEVTLPVSGEITFEASASATEAQVAAAVKEALAMPGSNIEGATVTVTRWTEARRLQEQRELEEMITFTAEWTSQATGTPGDQSAAAKVAYLAAESWQQDARFLVSDLASSMEAAGLSFTESSVVAEPTLPQGHVPTDLYEISWPPTPLATGQERNTFCSNWQEIMIGSPVLESTEGACAELCQATLSCTSFMFQKKVCTSENSIHDESCVIFAGTCAKTTDACFDVFGISKATAYEKTEIPTTTTTTQTSLTETSQTQTSRTSTDTESTDTRTSTTETTTYATETMTTDSQTTTSMKAPILASTVTVTTTKLKAGALKVFINEIWYKSANSANPGVEIAAPEGTDLSVFKVAAYNMLGNLLVETELSGTMEAASQQTYGVVWASLTCQRFSAVALVEGATVIQFLSVTDKVTAIEPPARARMSTVIKDADGEILQISDEQKETHTLQLYLDGLSYDAFKWKAGRASPEDVNVFQNFV